MADELMTQITKAINEQLPAHIGDVLRKRLETAASDANRVAELDKQNGELRFEVDKLKTELKIYDDLGKRRSELERLKAEVDAKLLKLEISELKVEQAAVRVKDMKEVVGMVFANNRYKYSECSSRQVPGDPGSYLHYASDSKSIQSEG
mgnify:FL=1